MLPARYLEPIMLVFHCLTLDNWRAVIYAVNLKMFLASLVYKEQFHGWFLGGISCARFNKMAFLRHCEVSENLAVKGLMIPV